MAEADVDYIKLSATARHLQDTVFNRAADNGVKLSAADVKAVMEASIEMAFLAHVPSYEVKR